MEKKPDRKAAATKKAAAKHNLATTDPELNAAPENPAKALIDPFAEVAENTAAKSPAKELVAKAPKANTSASTSPIKKRAVKPAAIATVETETADKKGAVSAADVTAELAATEPAVELSPVFKALAEPALPELTRENRARLLMQTPTRVYFYWAVKENPWAMLKNAFGNDTGSYTLVLKLTNLDRDTEEIQPCDAAGNWWFDVEPDSEYQAEVGFYAPNRPYFRILYSNTVETPRRSPSPHPASEAQWMVPASKFAEVLEVAGFTQDAFDVALAGDDHTAAQSATHAAFAQFAGEHDVDGISAEDIRYAMLAIASGATLEDLRHKVGPALFAILAANAENLFAKKAIAALGEHFDIDETEFVEEQLGSAVYGASLVNFPKTLTTKRISYLGPPQSDRGPSPLSSFGSGR